ncbi:GNAT family N-acetyltransferase [Pacificibacter marinus]|uniref:Acetyltransferase n=1 Tax=Pacificibacter marinus TaxID=658057 RepID=A0A1Y5RAR0_9RHOB|nr:GNAT family N-acetyltransferase [Pacificibacter marinus]SEK26636.1 putative acetyltransferase [Pacificibacter marinus]SLN12335.1 acetyltransferase [Pacificibacter marinus]
MNLRPLALSDNLALSIFLDSECGSSQMYRTVLNLRETQMVAMERIAFDEDQIVGYLCCAKMINPADWWVLSVLVVSSNSRRKGIGRDLVRRGMDDARRAKAPAVVVVGDPAYFAQMGFSQSAVKNLSLPFAQALTSLYPIAPKTGLSKHTLQYPESFVPFNDVVTTAV